mmetsp:Transcript_8585/g.16112  ORF Transcript_8585/g.16112 Transcript_8585/m.16112 type:complete len:289 (+) Transcript_8585:310-1176(+)
MTGHSRTGLIQDQKFVQLSLVKRPVGRGSIVALIGVSIVDEISPQVSNIHRELNFLISGFVEYSGAISEDIELKGELATVAHHALLEAKGVIGTPAVEGGSVIKSVHICGGISFAEDRLVSTSGHTQWTVEKQISCKDVECISAIISATTAHGVQLQDFLRGFCTKDSTDQQLVDGFTDGRSEQLVHKKLPFILDSPRNHRLSSHSSSGHSIKGLLGNKATLLNHRRPGKEVNEEIINVKTGGILLGVQNLIDRLCAHARHVIYRAVQVGECSISISLCRLSSVKWQS